jgi:membrane associated rhomboid family serine protease
MVSAPVGWQCPTCLKGAPKVRRMRDIQSGFGASGGRPYVTLALIAACVAVYAAQQANDGMVDRYGIVASSVARGDWYRLVTNGFLHLGPIHILFNMLLLFRLGSILEGRLGRARFLAVYALSLVGGSVGAMLLAAPTQVAAGASGAVFGLMGAMLAMSWGRRTPIDQSVGGLLVINLVLSFVIPGISIGAHLGGAAMGAVAGLVIRALGEQADLRRVAATVGILVALTAGLFAGARPLAEWRCSSETGPTISARPRPSGAAVDECLLPSRPEPA